MKIKVLLLLTILMFAGCGKKTQLTCTKKEKNAGYDYEEKYEIIYNDNKEGVSRINFYITATFNDKYTDEEINEELESLENYCSLFDMAEEKLISCKAKRNKNVISVDAKIKVEKIDDKQFELLMYVTKDEISNIKKTKKMLKNVGYTCK